MSDSFSGKAGTNARNEPRKWLTDRISRKKVAVGFGVAMLTLFCAVFAAGMHANAAREYAATARWQRLPFLESALVLEIQAYEAVFHAAVFALSGDMASYSASRIRLAGTRNAASYLKIQSVSFPGGKEFQRQLESLEDLVRQLDAELEKQRSLTAVLAAERKKVREAADAIRLLAAGNAGGGVRPGMAQKIGGLALAAERIAGTAGIAELATLENDLLEQWEKYREALRKDDPGLFSRIDVVLASCREYTGFLRFSLEEGQRFAITRHNVSDRLTELVRDMAVRARIDVMTSIARAEIDFSWATVFFLISACMTALMSTVVYVVFIRGQCCGDAP